MGNQADVKDAKTQATDVQKELKQQSTSGDHDLSHISQQVAKIQKEDPQHWQRNLATINKGVDMEKLGFPKDMKITGADDKGQLVGQTKDGTYHTYDGSGSQVDASTKEHQGTHDYQVDQSGIHGSIEKGDTLWGAAKDMVGKDTGTTKAEHQAYNHKVYEEMKKIQKENGIKDPNRIANGTELTMKGEKSEAQKAADAAAAAKAAHDAELAKPHKASELPPIDPKGTKDANVVEKTRDPDHDQVLPGGAKVQAYNEKIASANPDAINPVTGAQEQVKYDKNGHVVQRTAELDSATTMNVNGTKMDVTKVDEKVDPKTGKPIQTDVTHDGDVGVLGRAWNGYLEADKWLTNHVLPESAAKFITGVDNGMETHGDQKVATFNRNNKLVSDKPLVAPAPPAPATDYSYLAYTMP